MRMFTVTGDPSTAARSARLARELQQALPLAAPAWKLHTCVVGNRDAVENVDAAMIVDRDYPVGYALAARRIAASGADLVVVHHGRGLWGGPNGRFIADLVSPFRDRGVPCALIVHDLGTRSGTHFGTDGCQTLA